MKNDNGQQKQLMKMMVEQMSWVRTPWRYTMLFGPLSLIQQQALLMVSDFLQTYIAKFYDLQLDKAKDAPKSLFTEYMLKEGIPPFRIWLQDLGVRPNHYDAVRKAIDEINLLVPHPEIDDEGEPTGRTILTNVFSEFGFEESGEYYHWEDRKGFQQAVPIMLPYIDVKINPDVAKWAFDMSKGYVNHLKMIAMYSKKRPTPRIYLLLMKALRKEQTTADIRIPLAELKEYLGIAPTAYPMFSNFRQKVLDAVQQDLQRMAREVPPQTDITFTYDLQYPGSRKKGDPEAIIFHVEKTVLGLAYSVIVNHAKIPVEQDIFATDPKQQPHCDAFHKAMREIGREVTKEQAQRFRMLHFMEYRDRHLCLQIPDDETYNWVESPQVAKFFYAKLRRYFPDIRQLSYKVMG